jgi:predicted aldo/keto reductase-like oxidoreductase
MQYRDYGSTGKISALGFGCMRLPEFEKDGSWYVDEEKTTPMLRKAAALGVNYFDTGYHYCHHNSEPALGKALKPFRDQVLISTKCPMWDVHSAKDYWDGLERSLRELGTGYVDYFHFWSLDKKKFDEKVVGYGLLKEALRMKEQGLIRHISFSFHDEAASIKHIIDRAEIMETMLVQYNLLDRSNEEMIAYAVSKGVGVAAMGPVGGGRLAAPTGLNEKLTGKAMPTYELALKYVLGNPNVSCALSGMADEGMLLQNAAVASEETPLTEAEWRRIGDSLEQLRRFSGLYCTGCGYCQPCPAGINIPEVFASYTYHNVYGLSARAKEMYGKYIEKGGKTRGDCQDCGFCEGKCPQRIAVREQLERVEGVLESLCRAN